MAKLLVLGSVAGLSISCANRKAEPASFEEVPVTEPAASELVEVPPPEALPTPGSPSAPAFHDDGLRLPAGDLTQLPSDGDFSRPSIGVRPLSGGAVISRPPTEPPVRIKEPQD